MKSQKENSGDIETAYQCDFILMPRKENNEDLSEVPEPQIKPKLLLT